MKIENNNITVTAGDDNALLFRYDDYRNIVTEGIELFFTVKEYSDDNDNDDKSVYKINPDEVTYEDYTDDSGEEPVVYPNAIAVIQVSDSNKRLACGTYKYDLQRVDGGVSTIMNGSYTVTNDVTKRK